MRINHNIQALNAYRNLYQNQFQTSKNLERLSSGLRINRAADDAAGLAISEKMRSQIRGLKMAERNSLDGVSLMQVAEGAMTEVHSMLQRMRELAVQAANDTNTTSDRESIQLEIDQLKKEIDSIAAKTEFNTRKLLDGSSAVDTQYIVGQMQNTNIKDVPVVTDPSMATGKYQIGIESDPEIVYTLNQPGAGVSASSVLEIKTVGNFLTNESQNTNITKSPEVLDGTLKSQDGSYQVTVSNQSIGRTVTQAGAGFANGATGAFNVNNPGTTELPFGEYTIKVTGFTSGPPNDKADIEVYSPDGSLIGSDTGVNVDSDVIIGSGNKEIKISANKINVDGTAKITVEATADIIIEQLNADGTVNGTIINQTGVSTSNGTVELGGFKWELDPTLKSGTSKFDVKASDLSLGEYSIVVSDYQEDSTGVKSANIEVFDPDGFSIGQLAARIGSNGAMQTIGTQSGKMIVIDTTQITQAGTAKVQVESKMEVSVSKVSDDGTATSITFPKEITTRNGVIQHGGLEMTFGADARQGTSNFDLTNKALTFQIGANTSQNLNIDVPQLSTVKLDIDDINVLSHTDANDAIFRIEKAINQISATRAKLGATQNRLEHTISNLQTTTENLTASESRIRDADMALEMTEFTKNNILNQSAQAMLAQANQLPQGVLQLLQG